MWHYATGAYLSSSPSVGVDNVVYVGSYSGQVLALQGASGTLLWAFDTGSYVVSSPSIGMDGTLFIGSGNGRLYALSGACVRRVCSASGLSTHAAEAKLVLSSSKAFVMRGPMRLSSAPRHLFD